MFVAICSGYPFYIGYFDKTNGRGKRYLVCPSSSSGTREMKFHIFQNGGGGHFENWALAELAVTFERYIGAHFALK